MIERSTGNEGVPPPDWDFVHALEYGMPRRPGRHRDGSHRHAAHQQRIDPRSHSFRCSVRWGDGFIRSC